MASTLAEEADATTELPPKTQDNKITEKTFRPREALMARANSLKKAVKGLIDQTESGAYRSLVYFAILYNVLLY